MNMVMDRGLIGRVDLIELGEIIPRGSKDRTDDTQITIVDLTGVAVQYFKIATSVYES